MELTFERVSGMVDILLDPTDIINLSSSNKHLCKIMRLQTSNFFIFLDIKSIYEFSKHLSGNLRLSFLKMHWASYSLLIRFTGKDFLGTFSFSHTEKVFLFLMFFF